MQIFPFNQDYGRQIWDPHLTVAWTGYFWLQVLNLLEKAMLSHMAGIHNG